MIFFEMKTQLSLSIKSVILFMDLTKHYNICSAKALDIPYNVTITAYAEQETKTGTASLVVSYLQTANEANFDFGISILT